MSWLNFNNHNFTWSTALNWLLISVTVILIFHGIVVCSTGICWFVIFWILHLTWRGPETIVLCGGLVVFKRIVFVSGIWRLIIRKLIDLCLLTTHLLTGRTGSDSLRIAKSSTEIVLFFLSWSLILPVAIEIFREAVALAWAHTLLFFFIILKKSGLFDLLYILFTRQLLVIGLVRLLLRLHMRLVKHVLLALLEFHWLWLRLFMVLAAIATIGFIFWATDETLGNVIGNFLIDKIGLFLGSLLRGTVKLAKLLAIKLVLLGGLLVSRFRDGARSMVSIPVIAIVVVGLCQTVLVETFTQITHILIFLRCIIKKTSKIFLKQ